MSRDNDSLPKVGDNGDDSKRIEETMERALSKALNLTRAALQEAVI